MNELTKKRIDQSDAAARHERFNSPESIQNTKAARATASDGSTNNQIRMAYCAEDAPEDNIIMCFLGYKATEDWDDETNYLRNATVIYYDEGYRSLQDDNLNHLPEIYPDDWNSVTTYSQDEPVTRGSNKYKSLQDDNTNHDPSTSPEWWILYVNEWWEQLEKVGVICEICDGEDLNEASPLLVKGKRLFAYWGGIAYYHLGLPFAGTGDC